MAYERGRPKGLALLCVIALIIVGAFIGAGGAAAATPKALINGDSVSGGAGSREAIEATSQGYAVTVVGGATWGAMSQADFGGYDLLIIGDPFCGGLAGSVTANASVWGPVVMGTAGGRTLAGNRILIGTDPVLHGRYDILHYGMKFAGKQPGRTGLYLDTTCDYSNHVATIAMLNQLKTGTGAWTEDNSAPCGGAVSLIASEPSFVGLTSAMLAGWGCSVHETFPTFPTDWSALAVATDTATKPTCGIDPNTSLSACGQAYILIAGSSIVVVSGSISVSPLTGSDAAGGTHTVTAHVTAGGSPLVGQVVTWTITGQNAGVAGTCAPAGCVTDASGNVSFTYTDVNGAGSDTIKASFVDAAHSLQAATAAETWTRPLDADLSIRSKTDSADPVAFGSTFSYTITAANAGPAVATGVVITDALPVGLSFVSGAGCSAAGQTVTCPVGTLAVGASAAVTFTVHADAAGTFTDTASVNGDLVDLNLANNTKTETTTVLAPKADLAVSKTGPASIYWGNAATYSVTVKNLGPDAATGVVVSDTATGGTISGAGCTVAAGTATCSVGNLAVGASATVTLAVATTVPGTISDTATAAGDQTDPNAANDSDSVSTDVLTHPTAITNTGVLTSNYHDAAALSATLVDTVTGLPLAGKSVAILLGAQSCTDATNASGVATCTIVPNQAAGSYPLTASYSGSALYDAASVIGSFSITLEQTVTVYTGATAPVQNLASLVLSASLKEDGVTAIAGRNVVLTLGSGGTAQSCTGVTNAAGVATCTIVVNQAAGIQTLAAAFAGDAFYLASGDSSAVRVYSANSLKQDALATLNALAGPTGKKGKGDDDEDNRYASAARKVAKSLTPAWWNVDGIHLTLNGCGVFDNEKAAASQLRELLRSKKLSAAEKATIQGVIDALVRADQIIATTAVNEAIAGNGNAKKLALANKALAKAAALVAAGKPDEAINQYRIAWEKAQESLGRKVCGDDGHEDEDGHEGGHHDRSDD